MKLSLKTTFYWSLGGHAVLFLLLLISSLFTSCSRNRTPKEIHVFRLQAGPPAPKMVATPQPTATQPETDQKVEVIKPQPKPKPQETKPTPNPQTKTPTPKPTKRQPVSYAEFLKENQLPEPEPPQPIQPQRQYTPTPADPNQRIREELEQMIQGFGGMDSNSDELHEFNVYVSQLRSQLNRLWLQPDNLPPGKWSALIEFTVASNGKVGRVHFKQESGNVEFDQSLIKTMNAFVTTTPPPGGKAQVFTIPFSMTVR